MSTDPIPQRPARRPPGPTRKLDTDSKYHARLISLSGTMTLDDLAVTLGVSSRTIQRDLDTLEERHEAQQEA